ncbi:MAG: MBL fold metallo-hydrolase [Chloroflexi bacterium]|nr:MBL fold metallo-hydrolase [Chloroflexota bacterium]
MKCRLTTLSDNTVSGRPRGLLAEWGLSILMETEGITVLLDAGASVSAVHNGDILGIDWPRIHAIVLSHGHYDHTGGLRQVLTRINRTVKVVAHPGIFEAKYIQVFKDETPGGIGMPHDRQELERLGAVFQITREPVWLSKDVVTSGEIPMITDYEAIDPGMYVEKNGAILPDPLADDQALFIKTDEGLVVVLGCAHRGAINTLRHAQKVTGVQPIHTVVGGMHLIRASEVQLELTIAELKGMGVQRLGVCHCTGMPASVRLAQELGQSLLFNAAGSVVTF